MERVIKFRAFNTEDKEMYSHGVALKLLYESEISNEPIPASGEYFNSQASTIRTVKRFTKGIYSISTTRVSEWTVL